MLKYRNEFKKSIDKTIYDRQEFIKQMKLQSWVINVFHSGADFILVETSNKILELIDVLLQKESIYIRDISKKFNNNKTYFRFAVRTSKENSVMIDAINTYLKK